MLSRLVALIALIVAGCGDEPCDLSGALNITGEYGRKSAFENDEPCVFTEAGFNVIYTVTTGDPPLVFGGDDERFPLISTSDCQLFLVVEWDIDSGGSAPVLGHFGFFVDPLDSLSVDYGSIDFEYADGTTCSNQLLNVSSRLL